MTLHKLASHIAKIQGTKRIGPLKESLKILCLEVAREYLGDKNQIENCLNDEIERKRVQLSKKRAPKKTPINS